MNRTLIWKLAIRYLRGRKSVNAVPMLSRISMGAIAVCSAAMIIVFSVFNGLETVLKSTYNAFYPDLKISPARGKFFAIDSVQYVQLQHIDGVARATRVIEDQVFAVANEQQNIIMLKGIENSYMRVNDLKPYLSANSEDSVTTGNPSTAILGHHIMNELGTDVHTLSRITLNYANPDASFAGLDIASAIVSLRLHPAGEFSISDEFDSRYVLAPLALVQELFHQQARYSAIEIKVAPGSEEAVQEAMRKLMGPGYIVATRYEQNNSLYLVMRGEKWAIFAILTMVLLIATFNMIGALSMMVRQKQKDIAILQAMGADAGSIRAVFLLEGMLWALVGGLTGIGLGCGICLAQQQWGIIKMGGSFLVDAFPVAIQLRDVALTLVTLLAVGLLIAWYPATLAAKTGEHSLKSD